MAGLWDRWMGGGETLESFTIITTTPNGVVGEVHNRMPVILSPEDGASWLEQGSAGLCRPVADDFLCKTAEPPPRVVEAQQELSF
jgi:putative SOS response-associated peptidase YedK